MTLDDALQACPVVPVVAGVSVDDAVRLAHALADGGVTTFELTLRDDRALEALRAVVDANFPLVVGAGTVRTAEQLRAVKEAGAAFAVSPGLTPALTQAQAALHIPLLPGVATASEVMAATEAGFRTLKLFPATAVGGLATLKALAAPFPDVRWMPTGGIREDTAAAWLAHPAVTAVGGSWLVPKRAMADGDWHAVRKTAAHARATFGVG